MLCARRGESWKQKHRTLYPSSARLAAALAPASPVPTTTTVYLRLFAGLMSRCSRLNRDHLSASGPPGTFESSFIPASRALPDIGTVQGLHVPEPHRQHERTVADQDHERDGQPQQVDRAAEPGVL